MASEINFGLEQVKSSPTTRILLFAAAVKRTKSALAFSSNGSSMLLTLKFPTRFTYSLARSSAEYAFPKILYLPSLNSWLAAESIATLVFGNSFTSSTRISNGFSSVSNVGAYPPSSPIVRDVKRPSGARSSPSLLNAFCAIWSAALVLPSTTSIYS